MLFHILLLGTSTLTTVCRKQLCKHHILNNFRTSQAFYRPNLSTRKRPLDIHIGNFCFRKFDSPLCSAQGEKPRPENFLPFEVFRLYFCIPYYFNTPIKSLAKLITSFIKPLMFLFLTKFFMKRLYNDFFGMYPDSVNISKNSLIF